MSTLRDFYFACQKNLRKVLIDIFSGTSSTPNFSQLTMCSVTGPLDVDEDGNPTFGEIVDQAGLEEGPTKISSWIGLIRYVFKFDTSDEERRRAGYHILKLDDKVVYGYDLSAPLGKGFPYYVRIDVSIHNFINCGWFAYPVGYLFDKKTYTEYFGAIDGTSEPETKRPWCPPPGRLNSLAFKSAYKKYTEAIADVFISGSISSFFNELTIHNKKNVKCWDCIDLFSYFSDYDCFDVSDADKKVTIRRDKVDKFNMRCIGPILGQEDRCRYIFTVPGNSSKFRWAGLLFQDIAHYMDRYIDRSNLNDGGKPIKVVIHFNIVPDII
jgi:hypothetical protein